MEKMQIPDTLLDMVAGGNFSINGLPVLEMIVLKDGYAFCCGRGKHYHLDCAHNRWMFEKVQEMYEASEQFPEPLEIGSLVKPVL